MTARVYSTGILLCLALGFSAAAAGGIGDWKTFTSRATVEDIAAAGDSLLLATSGGVVVFDRNLQKFVAAFTNTEGLSGNHPKRVVVDHDGNWWFGMSNGDLDVFDPLKGGWKIFRDYAGFSINDLLLRRDSLFVGLNMGISLFLTDRQEAKETYQNLGTFPVGTSVWAAFLRGDVLWVGTDYGLAYANLHQVNLKAPQSWNNSTSKEGLISNKVFAITDFNGTLYAGTDRGVQAYIDGRWQTPSQGMPQRRVKDLLATKDSLYVIFDHEFYIYSRLSRSWRYEKYFLPQLKALFADRPGEVWLGTQQKGLARWRVSDRSVEYFLPDGPAGNSFADLAVDGQGRLWCASGALFGHGVYRFDGKNWKNYSFADQNPNLDNTVSVAVDSLNRVWVGSWGGGVIRFEKDGSRVNIFNAADGTLTGIPQNLNYVVVADIAVDQDGTVWLLNYAAYNGQKLVAFTPDSQWVHFGPADGLPGSNPVCIAVDQYNRKWIGTEGGGLYVYDDNHTPADKSDDQIVLTLSQSDGLESNSITALAVDDLNTVWIATTDGLDFYQGGRVSPFYGLITNDIHCITVDPVGNKWFGTSAGASILEEDIRWRHLTTENTPLASSNVLSIAFNPSNGTAYLGTSNGLSVYETLFTRPRPKLQTLHVFPNPFVVGDRKSPGEIIVDGLSRDAAVRVFSSGGFLVRKLTDASQGGRVVWDGRDRSGSFVPTGIYLIVAVQPDGKSARAKVAVIRR